MVIDANIECATFTVAEAARYLGVSTHTVYEALIQKQIPGRKIGSKWIISRQVLEHWLNQVEKK